MNDSIDSANRLMTGTTTLGLVCKGGIVLAADKRATAGNLIVTKHADKIFEIFDGMALTMAGTVSDAQLLVKLIKAELNLKMLRSAKMPIVREAANMLSGMLYNSIRAVSLLPGISHFVLGGHDAEGFWLYDLFPDGSLTDVEEYVCSGSGSVMAYGLLENLYKKDMSVDEGVELSKKAINAALQRDIYSGGGIDIVTITGEGIKHVVDKDLAVRIDA